jgi:hypothetical protein
MADGFSIDFSEFDKLTADIAAAPREAAPNISKAIEVTARHVKDGWKGRVEGSVGLEGLSRALSYDIKGGAGIRADAIEAEIGFDKVGQGSLGNISEFGSIKHPPRGYGLASLGEQQADFEKGLGMAIGDIL